MVRHSGFFILSVPVAVAVTAFAVGGHSGAIQNSPASSDSQNLPVKESACDESSSADTANSKSAGDDLLTVSLGPLRQNSRIVIGSLDLSGRPHVVTADWADDELESADSDENATRSVSSSEVDYIAASASRSIRRVESPLLGCRPVETVLHTSVDRRPSSPPLPSRFFLVPHFDQYGTVQEVSGTSLLASDHQVAVYADNYLLSPESAKPKVSDLADITRTAERLVQTLDSDLLAFVRNCVGPITDLDGDGRLSIVITELDRQRDDDHIPVRGCVRDRDFLEHGDVDFTGDIVYLHHSQPSGPELAAMLAHELTHAAVLSRMRIGRAINPAVQANAIPPWLNEAIAHWVELKITPTPEAFSHRIDLFRSNPARNPIVTHDASLSQTTRRGGSRAAGAMFLQSFVSHPDDIRLLLNEATPLEQRVTAITGSDFDEVFRTWTLSQANIAKTESLSDSVLTCSMSPQHQTIQRQISRRIYGTAFIVLQCDSAIPQLRITSTYESQLQMTVVEPQ